MPAAPTSPFARELRWLLVILAAAVPLTLALNALLKQVPALRHSLETVLMHRPVYVALVLYVLVVASCYLGRLGAYAATRLAQTTALPPAKA
jgi:hypothetical protein